VPVLLTIHTLSGALLGSALRGRPTVALAAGVGSHLALDALPHWGADGDDERWLEVARRDGIVSLVALAAVTAAAPPEARVSVVAGSLGAIAPDLRAPLQRYFGVQPYPEAFDELHTEVQRGRESPRRLPQSFAVGTGLAIAVGAVLVRLRRR
jgi:hypothetical protein